MFKWLFALPLIAFLDPLLLYWIWPHLSIWMQVGGDRLSAQRVSIAQ